MPTSFAARVSLQQGTSGLRRTSQIIEMNPSRFAIIQHIMHWNKMVSGNLNFIGEPTELAQALEGVEPAWVEDPGSHEQRYYVASIWANGLAERVLLACRASEMSMGVLQAYGQINLCDSLAVENGDQVIVVVG